MAGDSATFDRGIRKAIVGPFRSAFFLLVALMVLIIGRMIVDLVWTGSDPVRLQQAYEDLQVEATSAATLPEIGGSASERAERWSRATYEIVYGRTGVDRVLVADAQLLTSPELAIRRGAYSVAAAPHWQAVMLGTQTIAVRAALVPVALPTIAVAYLLAMLDGLIARAIRRAAGGRESATLYHRAKYFHVSLLSLALLVWFWSPIRIDLVSATPVVAATGALLLRIQLKFYKKYV